MASPVPRDHGEAVPEKKKIYFGPVARLPVWPGCPVARVAAPPGCPVGRRPVAARLPSTTQLEPKINSDGGLRLRLLLT